MRKLMFPIVCEKFSRMDADYNIIGLEYHPVCDSNGRYSTELLERRTMSVGTCYHVVIHV